MCRFAVASIAMAIAVNREAQAATGLLNNVPEAAGYTLAYEFPIPLSSGGWFANPVPYSVTNTASIKDGSFDRVAYYMELVKSTGQTQWVYVSMTAFTTNAVRLGVPRNYVIRNGLYDTAAPSNATIRSNVSGITNTDGCNTVNLEFWPSNYGGQNDYGVPGANAGNYDFGDGGASATAGHASMQIHNYGAKQTLFAYNQWGNAGTSNLGIGNQSTGEPDWTFNTSNIGTYSVRTLQILVRTLSVNNLPATNVTASSGWINGQLAVGNSCDVYAYWGSTDQGTNSGLWANSALMGTYSNGTFNLTRQVTGLAGGTTTWYTFLASNDVAMVWAKPSLNFVSATAPAINNADGASVSTGQAILQGDLTAGGTADIYVYWGPTDGGQSANYAHTVKLTDVPQGAFSTTISALSGFPYYYICLASNEAGVAWAPTSASFSLPAALGQVSYSLGLRGSVFQPVTFAQAAVDLRNAAYSVSPTRVFTGTQSGSVLSMAEVPGRNIVLSGPTYTWNEFGGSPGDAFVAALSGRFYPPVTGTYTFRWSIDDRGWMFMDTGDDGVFDSADAVGNYAWDGVGSRTLTAGQGYNVMFFSQESGGGDSLAFWYTPPGGSETYINPSAQPGQWRYASSASPAVSIANTPMSAGSLTANAATLTGDLYGKNWSFDVYAFWGTADGGKVAANWQTNACIGRFQDWDGPVSLAINGLMTNELYYYTFFISNGLTTAWAASAETFATDQVTIEAADAAASETGPDTGCFRVTRPDTSTNAALTVFYTLGGTAANGSDYTALTGSVTIPAGALSAEFFVSPLDDTVWQEGAETVVATLAAGNYLVGAASSAVVTIQDGDAAPSAWSLRMPIQFAGYNKAETLTNFPALVTLDSGLSGFSYDQFLSGANGDLRFTDESMTRELPYEIESWNAGGPSRVWVQVPAFTNNVTIWMLWRRAGVTAPAYALNGATWSERYVNVAHLSESNGTVGNSAMPGNVTTVSGVPVQAVPGMIGTGVLFDGLDDLISFGTACRPFDNFTFSAWVKTEIGHERDAQSTSGTSGTAGQRYAFDVEAGGSTSTSAGLSVGTNGLSVYEHASSYMPALAVYSNGVGSGWNHVTVTYVNRQPRIYRNGALVCTGLTSPRTPVFAPYRFGGQINGYGYFNGVMDEVRISSVPRSANWIWAEYMNAASNDVFATVGPVVSAGYPEIANQPASSVSANAATLNGQLSATGMAATAVAVYWGPQDGGTDASAWANTNWFAAPAAPGAMSKSLTGLASGTAYFYRYAATNAYATAWAPTTETLLTAAVTLQATDAAAAEEPADTGTFTVSRGAVYAAPLTVYYTFSGTAANGVDLSYLGGSVTIPAGSATATIVVSPLFNRNYLSQDTDTVTLTLASGGYMAGGPDSGTVTITNWQPSSSVGVDVPRNFLGVSNEPVTGPETLLKTSAGQMILSSSAGNTFTGDITVDTDGGILRIGGILGAIGGTGVTLSGMTAENTITLKRGGQLYIDDNATYNSLGSVPNRFGTADNRPAVKLEGGTLTLNGANYNTTVPQTFGPLNVGPGYNTVTSARNSGTPELVFNSLNPAPGAHVNFTGSSLGSAANASRIRFENAPAVAGGGGAAGTKTMSIIPGARSGTDWVSYDNTTGVRPLAASEYNTVAGNDLNAAGAGENVRMTAALTAFPPLSADKTVNSLNINVAAQAYWAPTNKLTLTSGQLISGVQNNQMVINYPSTLTAGTGSSDASLDISVFQNYTYIRSLITDNGSGKVTLTKNGGADLTLDGNVDNTYSGGTYVNEGRINTGGAAGRRYLGMGPVRVDAGLLGLGQAGATANASGVDYTAVNGAQISVATVPYTADDTFDIGPGSIIYGSWAAGMGLNALDRGMGVPATVPNITLAPDAIVAHSSQLTAPLSLETNTIRNLGTNADLYYGLVSDQNSPAGAITVGTNTPFKGLCTDRWDRRWSAGTINVAPGSGEIWLQGMVKPGSSPSYLYLGNWLTDGGPVIAPSDVGPLTANVIGNVILDDTFATYGDTSAGKPVTFAVKAGAYLVMNKNNAMGSGTGIADAQIEDGGSLTFWTTAPAGVNGHVTVKAGGRFQASNNGGLTGSGAVTFERDSVLEISTPMGFTGPQAAAIADALPPGQLVRLNADNYGSPVDMLDAYLGDRSPIYEVFGGDRRHANPLVAGTTVMTLNRDAATGAGGMLVNDYASRSFASAANGVLAIGPNGGTIAATSNTTLYVTQRISLGGNALTIGATNVLDRVLLPKLGTVQFNSAFGLNTALPGSRITVIPGATLNNASHTLPDDADVTVDGTLLVGGTEIIGSLAGSGLVNLQSTALTVGCNNTNTVFSGLLTNSLVTALLTKTGAGRLDVTASGHPYTGMFAVNNGILALSGDGAMATPAGTAAFTLSGSGTLLLDNSSVNNPDRLAGISSGITFQGGTFRFVGKDGEAAGEVLGAAVFNSGAATIDVVNGTGAGSSAEVVFDAAVPVNGTVNFTASNGTLGSSGDNPRVFFNGLGTGMLGFATVGGAPAYYDLDTGVRAFSLTEGTEFNGTLDQTGLDTKYTAANLHQPLNAARSVNSLWIDNPGAGNVVNLGSSGANSLTLTSGRLSLTGADDFALTRSGTSAGTLTRDANGTLFLGAEAGRTLTVGVPIANGAGLVEKDGAGTLVLGAANTFSGALTINAGTVRYAAGNGGDLAANAVNILNAGQLDYAGDTDSLGALAIYAGGVTNSAASGILTAGSLTMGGGPRGSSTYVDTGTGTGAFKLGGNVTFNALNDPDTATIAGILNLNGGTRTFTVNNSAAPGAAVDMAITATIGGGIGNGILKSGAGVLKLSGTNTFDGSLLIYDGGGTILLGNTLALGAPTAGRTLFIGNGGTLALDGNTAFPANYTNLFLNGAGDSLVGPVRGALANWSGSSTVSCPVTLLTNPVYIASIQTGDMLTLAGAINGTQDLYVNGDGDTELGGAITTGAKALVKNGTGTLTLSGKGTNTFSGTTTVNAGTLVLAKTNGVTGVNAIANGALVINNGGVLRYAAASTNPDLIGTGAVTLNGGAQLDFNGASDAIGAVTVAASGAITDTTNLLNTAGGGNLTVAALTVNPAPGLLTRMDSGTGTLSLGGNVTFNAAATGWALLSGKLALGGATRTLTVNTGVHTNHDMAIDAVISGSAGTGITKAGGGILRLDGANTFDGALSLAGSVGSVILGHPQALGTPSATRTATVGSGSTLALDGAGIYDPNNRIALNLNGTGNSRHGTVSGALVNLSGSNTVPCAVTLAGNTQIASLQAGGKLTLTGAFSGAYTLTVAGPGETGLAGSSGAIPSATGITVLSNGVLRLENSALTNNANRLGTMPLSLAGGALHFSHDAGAANYSESAGALTIVAGSNTVCASKAATGQTSALTFTSITCAGGTVNFVGEGLGESDQNRIFITGLGDGMIGPWAFINGTNLAMYSSALGVYKGSGAEIGVAALGGTANSVIPNNESASAVINMAGLQDWITLESVWTNRILEVRQEWADTSTVVRVVEGVTNRTLQTSRLMIGAGKASLSIGENDNEGAVMALSPGGTLTLENQNPSAVLAVKSGIANNGGTASGLSKFGLGPVVLTGSNSYSGATLISEGMLEFGGDLSQRLPGAISGAGTLAKSGTNQLHLLGANAGFTGPLYINDGIVRPDQNNAFGTVASGVYIASGATLDLGCDAAVGGTKGESQLYLYREEFTVGGAGVNNAGAIVNNGNLGQLNAINRIYLSADTTFGGKSRWDVRHDSPYIVMNDHTITKTGGNEIAIIAPVYPGAGHMVINQGLIRMESGALMNGSASNTVTVNRGASLELYNLAPFAPTWSLILNDGAFFRGGTYNNSSTNISVWAGPVTLNGTAFMYGYSSSGMVNWTIAGDVSGTGRLVRTGTTSSTLWLTGTNNTYSGGTIVSNGILYAKYPGSLPGYNDGRLTVAANGTLAIHASEGNFGFTAAQVGDLHALSSFTAANAYLSIDTGLASMDLPYNFTNQMGLIKQGTNTLKVAGLNTYPGNNYVNGGEFVFKGDFNHRIGQMTVGNATLYLTNDAPTYVNIHSNSAYIGNNSSEFGRMVMAGNSTWSGFLYPVNVGQATLVIGNSGRGILTIQDNASVTQRLVVGNNGGSAGAVYQNGGTLHNWGGQASDPRIGQNGYGYYELNSGTMTNNGYTQVGVGPAGVGILRQTGGSFQMGNVYNGQLGICRGGTGVVYTAGGTFACSTTLDVGESSENSEMRGFADFTVAGAADAYVSGNIYMANRSNMFATVNLNGGVLTANQITRAVRTNSTAYVNFDGGTFRSRVAGNVFNTGAYAPDAVNIYAGGATFDTTNFACTIASALRAPAGNGVASISIAPRGGYIGPPMVTISGGGGSGATAIAEFDAASGFVNGITVTCPGFGYTSAPAVSLSYGGTNIHNAATATISANASGGLTKLGTGTLTLSAANTYTGATTIAAGTLKLGTAAALMPNTPIILAGGTLDLNGFTVTNVFSGTGQIINGTVETLFSPAGPGVIGTNTLSLANTTVKGTYVADVTAAGACDRLDVQGDIDLSNLDLQLVDPDALDPHKVYTILSCTGVRTGKFKSANLPDSHWHLAYRADGRVDLVYVTGTVLWLR